MRRGGGRGNWCWSSVDGQRKRGDFVEKIHIFPSLTPQIINEMPIQQIINKYSTQNLENVKFSSKSLDLAHQKINFAHTWSTSFTLPAYYQQASHWQTTQPPQSKGISGEFIGYMVLGWENFRLIPHRFPILFTYIFHRFLSNFQHIPPTFPTPKIQT